MKNKSVNKTASFCVALLAIYTIILIPCRPVSANSTWTAYNVSNSPLSSDYISSIDFDAQGNQYIGTSGGGLNLKQGESWTVWNQSNMGVPINAVRRVVSDNSSNLWVAAASGDLDSSPYGFGVFRLDAVDSTWSSQNNGLEINQLTTGIIIDGSTRYVSTYGGGITIYNDTGWIRYRYNSRTEFTYSDNQQRVFNVPGGTYLPSDYLKAIDMDCASGELWIATANGGAVKYDGSAWTNYTSGNSGLPSNQLLTVKVDPRMHAVAFGTAGFGAAVFDLNGWTVYNPSNSPMTNGFISTLEYRPEDGELWLGTGYGVWVRQTDGQWRGYIPPDNNFIWGSFYSDISFDSTGSVWVSAYGGGMASLLLRTPPPPPPDDTLDIGVDQLSIHFCEHSTADKLRARLSLSGVPPLTDSDSISFRLDSEAGELYYFVVSMADFTLHGCSLHEDDNEYGKVCGDDDDEDNDGDSAESDDDDGDEDHGPYLKYRADHLTIFLGFNPDDSSMVDMRIRDNDADMNRENYSNYLQLTLTMGSATGAIDVHLERNMHYHGEDDDIYDSGAYYELVTTAIDSDGLSVQLADQLELGNFPNPFNGNTKINFNLAEAADVDIAVYDMLGRVVNKLHSGYLNAGSYSFDWPTNSAVTSGVYLYRVSINGQRASRKMLFLK